MLFTPAVISALSLSAVSAMPLKHHGRGGLGVTGFNKLMLRSDPADAIGSHNNVPLQRSPTHMIAALGHMQGLAARASSSNDLAGFSGVVTLVQCMVDTLLAKSETSCSDINGDVSSETEAATNISSLLKSLSSAVSDAKEMASKRDFSHPATTPLELYARSSTNDALKVLSDLQLQIAQLMTDLAALAQNDGDPTDSGSASATSTADDDSDSSSAFSTSEKTKTHHHKTHHHTKTVTQQATATGANGVACPAATAENLGQYIPGCPGYGRRSLPEKRELTEKKLRKIVPALAMIMEQMPSLITAAAPNSSQANDSTFATVANLTDSLTNSTEYKDVIKEFKHIIKALSTTSSSTASPTSTTSQSAEKTTSTSSTKHHKSSTKSGSYTVYTTVTAVSPESSSTSNTKTKTNTITISSSTKSETETSMPSSARTNIAADEAGTTITLVVTATATAASASSNASNSTDSESGSVTLSSTDSGSSSDSSSNTISSNQSIVPAVASALALETSSTNTNDFKQSVTRTHAPAAATIAHGSVTSNQRRSSLEALLDGDGLAYVRRAVESNKLSKSQMKTLKVLLDELSKNKSEKRGDVDYTLEDINDLIVTLINGTSSSDDTSSSSASPSSSSSSLAPSESSSSSSVSPSSSSASNSSSSASNSSSSASVSIATSATMNVSSSPKHKKRAEEFKGYLSLKEIKNIVETLNLGQSKREASEAKDLIERMGLMRKETYSNADLLS